MQIPLQADISTIPARDRSHRHGDGDECLSEGRLPADSWQRRPDCRTDGRTECRWDNVCERHAGEDVADGGGLQDEGQQAPAAEAQWGCVLAAGMCGNTGSAAAGAEDDESSSVACSSASSKRAENIAQLPATRLRKLQVNAGSTGARRTAAKQKGWQ